MLAVVLGAAGPLARAAETPDPDLARLSAVLAGLDADPATADRAALERYKARQAVSVLQMARSRDREHALYLAEAWVQAARDAAQADALRAQAAELDQERDAILLEASRRNAQAAQAEAERLRTEQMVREEESQRQAEADRIASEQAAADTEAATAQASQAMKVADARAKEAELARKQAALATAGAALDASAPRLPPSRRQGGRTVYTLPGTAFGSGSATLAPGGEDSLILLADALHGKSAIRIEAYTDSQGSASANLALSAKRADAVRRVLAAAGVPGNRIQSIGRGEVQPVADNTTAAGRARNRRVEISAQ
jgi:outer membrane protein OmpA-like peptidoglycan-associated protein